MSIKAFYPLILIALSILSGTLLFLSFPDYGMGWLVWVGLVPFLIAISGRTFKVCFLLSYIFGIIFISGVFNWILAVPGYTLLHHAIIVSCLASYLVIFGLAFALVSRRCCITMAMFSAPFIWVSLEFMRSSMSFMALPWPLLAHAQYQNPAVIQIASFTGAYGISFLIVLVNAAVAAFILRLFPGLKSSRLAVTGIPSLKGTVSIICTATVFSAIVLLYGKTTLSRSVDGEVIKACVVQGNIEQTKKWDPKYADSIMQTYIDLSKEGDKDQPDLIIWPEAATPGYILKNTKRLNQISSLTRQTRVHYLIGSTESPKFKKTTRSTDKKYGNTALFISPEGKLLGQYLKIRLLPFVENIPYEGHIKWPEFIVPKEKKTFLIQGEEFTIFELDGAKFGVSICWESIFPDMVRRLVQDGAQLVINITNEAWFGKTAAPYQFLSMSVFRAVENRVFVVRCANTGISCFIDPMGRVVDRVSNADGQDIFVRGVLTGTVIPSDYKTVYTRCGDWLVWVSILSSLFFLLLAMRGRRAWSPTSKPVVPIT